MSKHVYTCPDVIYIRNRAKRNNLITLAVVGATFVASLVWVKIEERNDNKIDLEFTPEDLEV